MGRRVSTFCFAPATDADNCIVVETLGKSSFNLASGFRSPSRTATRSEEEFFVVNVASYILLSHGNILQQIIASGFLSFWNSMDFDTRVISQGAVIFGGKLDMRFNLERASYSDSIKEEVQKPVQ